METKRHPLILISMENINVVYEPVAFQWNLHGLDCYWFHLLYLWTLSVHECEFFDATVDSGRVSEGLFVDRIRLDGSVDDALELDYYVDLPEESLIFVTTIFEAHRRDFSHLLRS